jgi:hypothetical protein
MKVVLTSVSATEEKTASSARAVPISQPLFTRTCDHRTAHFEFRAESYNTFNHTEFNDQSTSNSTGGQYGTATGDWGPRVLQLGSKIVF